MLAVGLDFVYIMRVRWAVTLSTVILVATSVSGICAHPDAQTQQSISASVKEQADNATEPDTHIQLLSRLAEVHYSIDPIIACGYAEQARELAKRHGEFGFEGHALNQLARCAIDRFEFKRAKRLLDDGFTLAASFDDGRWSARNKIFRAQLNLRSPQGSLADSIELLDSAFTLAEEVEDPVTQIEALLLQSELYYRFRDRQLYLETLGLAAKLAVTSAKPEWAYVQAFHLAAVASADGDRNGQLLQYTEVCDQLRSQGMTWRWAYFLINLARTQRAVGQLNEAFHSLTLSATAFALTTTGRHYSLEKQFGRYYQAIGDWDSARAHYRTLLKLHKGWGDSVGQIENLRALAELAIETDEVDTAAQLFGQALSIAEQIDDSYRQRSIVLQLARLAESRGQPTQAYKRMIRANELSMAHEKNLVENSNSKMNARLKALDLRSQERLLVAENKSRYFQTIALAIALVLACAAIGAALYHARKLGQQKAQLAAQGGQLRIACDRLDQLHREKVDLIQILAHDMRGAVTEIVLTSELLGAHMRGNDMEGILGLSDRFSHMASRLKNQLESLLAWGQSSNDGSIMRLDEINLTRIAEECANDLSPVLSNKGLKLETSLRVCPPVQADPDAVRVIINNLVLNAYKFSRPGAVVQLQIRQIGEAVELGVRDFGSGMDPDQLQIVRSGSATESRPGTGSELGLGIGLSLVQRLTDRMGAELRIESSLGKGTVAVVRFHRDQRRQAAA